MLGTSQGERGAKVLTATEFSYNEDGQTAHASALPQ